MNEEYHYQQIKSLKQDRRIARWYSQHTSVLEVGDDRFDPCSGHRLVALTEKSIII